MKYTEYFVSLTSALQLSQDVMVDTWFLCEEVYTLCVLLSACFGAECSRQGMEVMGLICSSWKWDMWHSLTLVQDKPIDVAVEWTVHLTHMLEVSCWILSPLAIYHDWGFLFEADTRIVPKTGLTWPSILAVMLLQTLLLSCVCLHVSGSLAIMLPNSCLVSVYVVLASLAEMLPHTLLVSHLSTQNEVPWMVRTLLKVFQMYIYHCILL